MNILITGVTSGIGRALTKVYIEKGHRVIGVARRKERLEEIQEEFGKTFVYVVWDLSKIDRLNLLVKEIDDLNIDIDIVINNAGIGTHGEFFQIGIEDEFKMIDLNIKSITYMTKEYLRRFRARNSGGIINIASTASFQRGGPLMAGYYGTKSYVLTQDEGIRGELEQIKGNEIRVMTLCPGPTSTEFVGMNPREKASFYITTPEDVARECYKGYINNKEIVIPGLINKALYHLGRFIPRRLERKLIYSIQKKKRS